MVGIVVLSTGYYASDNMNRIRDDEGNWQSSNIGIMNSYRNFFSHLNMIGNSLDQGAQTELHLPSDLNPVIIDKHSRFIACSSWGDGNKECQLFLSPKIRSQALMVLMKNLTKNSGIWLSGTIFSKELDPWLNETTTVLIPKQPTNAQKDNGVQDNQSIYVWLNIKS